MAIEKFTSKTNPNLKFWAEKVGSELTGLSTSYCVISQYDGFPATEAHDDWFGKEDDAIEIAEKLANGESLE